MRKIAPIVGILLWLMPAVQVHAVPPPAHGEELGGWGMNPAVWDEAGGNFSQWGIYDPTYGGDPLGWVTGSGYFGKYKKSASPAYQRCAAPPGISREMMCDQISLELWVEAYMILTYESTAYLWHRLGDAGETITFIIEGTTQSNSEIHVSLMPGTDPLTHLVFVEDIHGRSGSEYGSDIEIDWRGRWGSGSVCGQNILWDWQILTPEPSTGMLSLYGIAACDHWFQFEGSFTIPYHTPDGYYRLMINGCPIPVL
jgi:hypothetical protein